MPKDSLMKLVFGLSMFLLFVAPVWGDFDAGLDAYERGDYETALKIWRPLAEQGNAHAQYFLGKLYKDGQGVPQDYEEAARWYRLAAKQGHAKAQYSLGWLYEVGKGVPTDKEEAARWYQLAAQTEVERQRQEAERAAQAEKAMQERERAEAQRARREQELTGSQDELLGQNSQPLPSRPKSISSKDITPPHHDEEQSAQPIEEMMPQPRPSEQAASEPSDGPFEADRILDSMKIGNIAFNTLPAMELYETAFIQLLLDMEKSVEDLKQRIEEAGEKGGQAIRVSNRMRAQLSGDNFHITPITPEEQAVTGSETTEWKWQIKPKEEGKHRLHLIVSALIKVEGETIPRVIKTFDRTIEVEVTLAQRAKSFVQNNWQWLWAVVIVPLGGWLWNRMKKGGKSIS